MPDRLDPYEALRRPMPQRRPRPDFAAALQRRLMEELHMSITDDLVPVSRSDADQGQLRLVHLAVRDADRAMRFFGSLFGWVGERRADDHVSHYTLNTAVTVRLLDDPEAVPVRPNFSVMDVGMAAAAIEAAGGQVADSNVTTDGGGWAYAEDREGVPLVLFRPEDRPYATSDAPVTGDVGFVFIQENGPAAAEFYGDVLGWRVRTAHPGSNFFDPVDHVGIFDSNATFGTDNPASVTLFLEVPALLPALTRIRDLGGQAGSAPTERSMGPYFAVPSCTDDQGTSFGLVSTTLEAR